MQADREFRPGRDQDDQICRNLRFEMWNSAANRGAVEERSQEHRKHAKESMRRGTAGATRTGGAQPARKAGVFSRGSGSDTPQERGQHVRKPPQQTPPAMTWETRT